MPSYVCLCSLILIYMYVDFHHSIQIYPIIKYSHTYVKVFNRKAKKYLRDKEKDLKVSTCTHPITNAVIPILVLCGIITVFILIKHLKGSSYF